MSGAHRSSSNSRRTKARLGVVLAWVAVFGLAAGAAGAQDAAAGAAGAQEVGRVVALTGSVRVEGPDGSRALSCGDAVRAGERVVVAENGRVGVLSDAVYAQIDGLDGASRLRAELSEQGLPDWTLEVGKVRLVDTRGAAPSEPRLRLATPTAVAAGQGGDSEAYVLDEKAGAYSMVCEWGEPLRVARDGDSVVAAPGECAIAKPGEPIYTARAQEERIPLAGPDACVLAPALGPLASRFNPTDVAAPPPPGSLLPPAPPTFARQPCDNPGSGCSGGGFGSIVIPDGGIGVIEPGTGPGTIPGLP